MKKALVTIVIPVYKVEKFIHRCVDSVIRQSYRNLQVILVDDGSPDRCGNICDEYEKYDNRIKVVHQLNAGLSAARNTGLRYAKGDFVYFLDSDDYIAPTAIEKMLEIAINNQADIVMAGHSRVEPDGRIHSDSANWPHYDDSESIKLAILRNKLPNFAWGKLYKKELWNHFQFPVDILVEDMNVIADVFFTAQNIMVIRDSLYFYSNENTDSIMKGKNKKYILLHYGQFLGWKKHEKLAEKFAPRYKNECAEKAMHAAIRTVFLDKGINLVSQVNIMQCENYIREHARLPLKIGDSIGREIIVSHRFLVPFFGVAQRAIIEKQIKNREKENS